MNKAKNYSERYLVELSQNHMNTTFHLQVSVPEILIPLAESTLEKIHLEISALESRLSEFKVGSDVMRLNQAPVHEAVSVSEHTLALCEISSRVAAFSSDAFNPAFRSLDWASEGGGFKNYFSWDEKCRTVTRLKPNSHLGWGAIGKGYALDQAAHILQQEGLTHFRLESGGSSIIVSGEENHQVPWTIGFAWKKKDQDYLGYEFKVLDSPVFIGVSGVLEKGEHILTPSSQSRANPKNVAQVLVTAKSATEADAFSTALFADPALAENYIDGALLFVDHLGQITSNQKFYQIFQ